MRLDFNVYTHGKKRGDEEEDKTNTLANNSNKAYSRLQNKKKPLSFSSHAFIRSAQTKMRAHTNAHVVYVYLQWSRCHGVGAGK